MRAENWAERDVQHARRRPAAEPGVPIGVNVAGGSAVMVVAALVAAAVPESAAGVRLGVVAVALAAFTVVTVDLRAAAVVTVLGYLVMDGFLVNRMGELSWRGAADIRRFAILAAGALAGLGVGAVRRRVAEHRRFAPVEAWANNQRIDLDEGEWHGAGPGVRAVDGGAVRAARAGGTGGGTAMSVENLVGLVLAVVLTVFLVLALLLPEKF